MPWPLILGAAGLGLSAYGMYQQQQVQQQQEREQRKYQKYGQKAMDRLMEMMEAGPGEYKQSGWYKAQEKAVSAQLRKGGVSRSGLAERHMMELGGMDYERFLGQHYQRMMPYWNIAQGAGIGTAGMSGRQQSLINQMTMAAGGLSNFGYFANLNQQPGYNPSYYRDIGAYGPGNPAYTPQGLGAGGA